MSAYARHRSGILSGAFALAALAAGITLLAPVPAAAQQRDCLRPLPDPITVLDLPGGEPLLMRDGCWLFTVTVETPGFETRNGIAILRRTESGFTLHRFVSLPIPRLGPNGPPPFGMALTSDEKLLVVSHNQRLSFLDVTKLISTQDDAVLGVIESPRLSRSWGVAADDKYAYAAQQGTAAVVVVDLDKVRKGVFDESALGLIPTALGATTLLLSRDGRHLYTTTFRPPDVLTPTAPCVNKEPQGAVQIADVQKARTAPGSATVGWVHPAGCQPLWVTLSPDGNRLTVAAPGAIMAPSPDSAIVVFDVSGVRDGKPASLISRIPVPPQVGRIVDGGDRLFLSFGSAPGKPVNIMVIDASKVASGTAAIMGTLPHSTIALTLSSDGRTLVTANTGWTKLAIVDLTRVKPEPQGK